MTDVPSKQRIGSIDLGHMGGPMHVNLVAAGHDVFGTCFPAEANETARVGACAWRTPRQTQCDEAVRPRRGVHAQHVWVGNCARCGPDADGPAESARTPSFCRRGASVPPLPDPPTSRRWPAPH